MKGDFVAVAVYVCIMSKLISYAAMGGILAELSVFMGASYELAASQHRHRWLHLRLWQLALNRYTNPPSYLEGRKEGEREKF